MVEKCGPFPDVKGDETAAYWRALPVIRDIARRTRWGLTLYAPLRCNLDMVAIPYSEEAVTHDDLLRELLRGFGGHYSDEVLAALPRHRQDATALCRRRLLKDDGHWIDVSVIDPRFPRIRHLKERR